MKLSRYNKLSFVMLFWCAAVILYSCVNETAVLPPNNPSEAKQKEALRISTQPADNACVFGELSKSVITIENISDKAVIVLAIIFEDNKDESISLTGSVYGSIVKSADGDFYEYNSFAQQSSGIPLYSGFLLPEQQISVGCCYRALSKQEELSVKYLTAIKKYDGTFESLNPFKVYIYRKESAIESEMNIDPARNKELAFRPFREGDWLNICGITQFASQPGPDSSQRDVLLPGIRAGNLDEQHMSPITQSAVIQIPIKEEAFFRESARETAAGITKMKPENIIMGYSPTIGGYVVFETDLTWVLKDAKQKERGIILPQFPLSMLNDIERTKAVRVKVGDKQDGFGPESHDANRKFWDTYPVFYGDGMYTHGEFIDISKTDLLSFLKMVKESKGNITELKYYFQSRYFVLTLPDADK